MSSKNSKTIEQEIQLLLDEGEGYKIEFKERLANLDKEMVAFSNASGGTIYLGIKDDNTIVGFNLTNKIHSQIINIGKNCDPAITPRVEKLKNNIVSVYVPSGDMKPYRCSSGFYIRVGPNSEKLKTTEIIDLVLSAHSGLFDETINSKCKFPDDFSEKAFLDFCDRANITPPENPLSTLRNLSLAEVQENQVHLTNAAVLLFSNNPKSFFRHSEITCVRFKGTDRVDVIDRKDFSDTLFENLDNAVSFVKRNTRVEYKIDSLKRKEFYEYDESVIREAILNAIVHRNYLDRQMNIQVNIFDDRIEIVNPGGLVKGMTIDDLGTLSVHRNPIISDIFFRAGLIEKIGSGIRRIRDIIKSQGGKMPEFKSTETYFQIVIRSLLSEKGTSEAQVGHKLGTSEAQVQMTPVILSIVKLCSESPKSSREIKNALGHKKLSGYDRKILSQLVKDGYLSYTIPEKPRSSQQKYMITEKGKKVLETWHPDTT